ncbi:thiamine diphosphokinase [Primorskyibacter sp. S87]|uniref:thiamine diphosphokinase n=1 Tax=Primorskyibacter sp. S87 TaxID=3415126 RepID=UPI003C7E1AE0
MTSPIVQSSDPVTLVGGGDLSPEDISQALSVAPCLVAADGGARAVIAEGHEPRAVIGDFDSLQPEDRANLPQDVLFPIREQDSTDFDKALRNIQAPLVLGVGFLGGRIDHQLAVFNALVRHADRPCLLLGAHEVIFHAPQRLELSVEPGSIVSLFPLASVTGRSHGLEWPIDGLQLAPDGRVGTSNRALGPIVLEMDTPGLLVLVPRVELNTVIRAFGISQTDSAERLAAELWPARAK